MYSSLFSFPCPLFFSHVLDCVLVLDLLLDLLKQSLCPTSCKTVRTQTLLIVYLFWNCICFTLRSSTLRSSTLRSWLHKILPKIEFCPWIGEQPYIKTLFGQFSNINIYAKIVGKCKINILMYHYSPIQGTRSKKREQNYGPNLSPTFNKHQDRVPWIGEQQYIEILFWYFSNNSNICVYVGKLP